MIFTIYIKFKNYKNIIPGEKRLNAKIICDSENKINKDSWNTYSFS